MKIRFVREYQGMLEGMEELVAECDVAKKPTKKEIQAIYDEISKQLDKYDYEEDIDNKTYSKICMSACKKHIEVLKNPVVHTFYLY